ncbi:MAG: ATP-binding protein [Planctomycetaceae bacterium]|jgi:predicted ATPase/predicted transport protein|nr:ATP-binding protein [Planctomycetaceae bacterium]
MFFEIDNIGKVQNACIEMCGITVLAGNNSTGKSTFGKSLFSIFNAFYESEQGILRERKKSLKDIIFRSAQRLPSRQQQDSVNKIVDAILDKKNSSQEIRKIIRNAIEQQIIIPSQMGDDSADTLFEKIRRSVAISAEQIQKNILTQYLCTEFDNQITHIEHPEQKGNISLTIKNNKLDTLIQENKCINYIDEVGIIYQAFYLDSPFVMDKITPNYNFYPKYNHRGHLIKKLRKTGIKNSIIDTEIVRQKFETILVPFYSIVGGEFKNTELGLGFQENSLSKPLVLANVSAGMKPFLIIKRLLENGELKEQNILILDEPEIHLHPEWQLVLAELLVLLQKEFDLTILLTTHSPYFLHAIEVYSAKQKINNRCNYYLTINKGKYCSVQNVTNNTDGVYQKLAKPFQTLENLRYAE